RRRPGDRFRPAGGRGSRRIQDFFVDRKVPRQLRDAWPMLVGGGGILWVAGLRADARAADAGGGDVIWVGLIREREEERPDDAR
ncbi:MAG: tRNA lysidine(34) synthetase TilS, partial [Oscillochloris sp.]|nr:tRNA lysidine(34) synthetase TilS [Oscillochloris sp.]